MDKRRFRDGSVLVGFELPPTVPASTVSVCGDFNGWQPDMHPLTRLVDGRFRTDIVFPAGERRRFRYLVDGERWENDPAADDYAPNGLGADDSVVDLTETSSLPVIPTAGTGPGEPGGAPHDIWAAPREPDTGASTRPHSRTAEGPGLQRVRIQQETWQRIENEAMARGVATRELIGDLIEAAMSPHLCGSDHS